MTEALVSWPRAAPANSAGGLMATARAAGDRRDPPPGRPRVGALGRETDRDRIVVLYEALGRVAPRPVVEPNRAVAVAVTAGPAPALAIVDELIARGRLPGSPLVPTVRGNC